MKRPWLIFIILFLFYPGFSVAQQGTMEGLRAQLLKRFPAEKVEVAQWGEKKYDLMVNLVNSNLYTLETSRDMAQQNAKQIAEFIKANYPDIGNVRRIAVQFLNFKTLPVAPGLIHLNNSNNFSAYFDVKDL